MYTLNHHCINTITCIFWSSVVFLFEIFIGMLYDNYIVNNFHNYHWNVHQIGVRPNYKTTCWKLYWLQVTRITWPICTLLSRNIFEHMFFLQKMPTIVLLDTSLSMTRPVSTSDNTEEYQRRHLAIRGISAFLDHLTVNAKLEFVSLVSARNRA